METIAMTMKLVFSIVLAASTLPAAVRAQTHVGPQVPVQPGIEVPRDGVTVPMQDMGADPWSSSRSTGKGRIVSFLTPAP
jgi:hypothetical protein